MKLICALRFIRSNCTFAELALETQLWASQSYFDKYNGYVPSETTIAGDVTEVLRSPAFCQRYNRPEIRFRYMDHVLPKPRLRDDAPADERLVTPTMIIDGVPVASRGKAVDFSGKSRRKEKAFQVIVDAGSRPRLVARTSRICWRRSRCSRLGSSSCCAASWRVAHE